MRAGLVSACTAALLLLSVGSGASAATWSVSLNGTWRSARGAVADAPPGDAEWEDVEVPGFVGWERKLPVWWFRRSFTLPDDMPRGHIFLRFEGVKYAARVFVNGVGGNGVGGHVGGFEPFEADVTRAVREGTNDLIVRVHDWTALVEGGVDWDEVELRPGARAPAAAKDRLMHPVGSQTNRMGIWQDVTLVARPDVYVEDVFVRTSVREGRIAADVTVRNLTDAPRRVRIRPVVVNKDAERIEKRLGTADVTAPAAGRVTRTFEAPWPDAKLWWPDRPKLYFLHVELEDAGGDERNERVEARVTDFGPPHETRFGFREFRVEDGIYFALNGRRVKLLATAGHPTAIDKQSAYDTFLNLRDANVVAFRLHAQPWGRAWYDAADEVGMLIVHESAVWCESNSYALSKPQFWESFRAHLEAQIRLHRNRPSVVIWSLENELLHCGGDRVKDCEHRLAELGRFVKKLDPTRLVMYDADDDPSADGDPQGVADVVNLHYSHEYPKWTLWPQTGEWVDKETVVSGWPRRRWRWDRKKPLYMGEFMWVPSQDPRAQTLFLGDEAYLDRRGARRRGKVFAWGMQVEAFRRLEVSGMCPWTFMEIGGEMREVAAPMYEPHAAIVREYDSRFFAGDTVKRTLTVHNDVLRECDVAFAWTLVEGDRVHSRGRVSLGRMRSAGMRRVKFGFVAPEVERRTDMALRLIVTADGREAYRIDKPCVVYPRRPLVPPAGARPALYDPEGETDTALREAGLELRRVADLREIPAGTGILLVGARCFRGRGGDVPVVGEADSDAALVARFARGGGAVIVFEQEHYPDELPGTLSAGAANFTFPRDGYAGLFAGLSEQDFRWWRGDNVVVRRNLVRPRRGGYRVLVEAGSGEGLAYAPLLEVTAGPEGKGRFILSQLALVEKLNSEPVARLVVQRLLDYAAAPREPTKLVALVYGDDAGGAGASKLAALGVETVGVKASDLSTREHAGAICAVASPRFAAARDAIGDYVRRGGVAILRGITAANARRLDGIVPAGLTFRPRTSLPVGLGGTDRLTRGLTNESLYWHAKRTGSWRSATPLTGDIARLELSRAAAPGRRTAADMAEMRPRKLRYFRRVPDGIHMSTSGGVFTELDFPPRRVASGKEPGATRRSGACVLTIRAGGTPAFGIYPVVEVRVDGRRIGSVALSRGELDDYSLVAEVEAGRREVELVFTNDAWNPPREDRNLLVAGLEVAPAAPLPQGVTLLTNPGCLVKIERGEGSYLIDLVSWDVERRNSDKAARVITPVLMNLGARFRPHAGGTRVSGASMEPMPGIRGYRTQGDVACLAANGWIARTVRFASPGEYELALTARGTELGGIYSHFEVRLDGETVGRIELETGGPETHSVRAGVEAGRHEVAVAFVNDEYDPPADRNAYVEEVRIRRVGDR